MADISRILALGAQTQAQNLTYKDFEGEFSETSFLDRATAAAMLTGMIFEGFLDLCVDPSSDWDGKLDFKRIRGVLSTAKRQVAEVQETVDEMIVKQVGKCKEAGRKYSIWN